MNQLLMQEDSAQWQPESRSTSAALVYGMLFAAMIAVQVGMLGAAAVSHTPQVQATA